MNERKRFKNSFYVTPNPHQKNKMQKLVQSVIDCNTENRSGSYALLQKEHHLRNNNRGYKQTYYI